MTAYANKTMITVPTTMTKVNSVESEYIYVRMAI